MSSIFFIEIAFGFLCLSIQNNNIGLPYRMNNQSSQTSLLQRTIAWINQHAYQPAKNIFIGKAKTTVSPQKNLLLFSNIVNNQTETRKLALSHVRNRHRKNDQKQQRAIIMEKLKKISYFWGKRQETEEKPLELICPICMDFLVGGVSTKCGHTFCWQCLDEAVLLNPGCPVCRSEIRGSDFLLSHELTAIIRRYLKRYSNENERQHQLLFNARAQEFEEWLLLRMLNPQRIKSSDLVDVRDTEHIWCSGLIKQIWEIQGRVMVLIHYLGWSSLYDEVIPIDSQRLASYRLYSSHIPHYQFEANEEQLQGFVVEEPEPAENQSSEEEEDQYIQPFEEDIQIQILEENQDEEQEFQMSSAKPLHCYNPQE